MYKEYLKLDSFLPFHYIVIGEVGSVNMEIRRGYFGDCLTPFISSCRKWIKTRLDVEKRPSILSGKYLIKEDMAKLFQDIVVWEALQ